MIKASKFVQYNHNWNVYNINDLNTSISKVEGTYCYSQLRSYFSDKNTKIVIWSKREKIVYTNDEIVQYISLINQIGIFKFEYNYDVTKDICEFTICPKDYNNMIYFVAAMMTIRYLWEFYGEMKANDMKDEFYKIPGYFIKLHEKYPEEDLLYLLLRAHAYMIGHKFNSNHSFIKYDINLYPFKLKDLVLHNIYVNDTFTMLEKKDYNKTIEEYKQELKDFKLFE